MSGPRTISGSVIFRQPIATGGGTVRVLLENTSRADAAATLVAQAVEPLTGPVAAGERRAFRLTVLDVEEDARYEVRVHVDRADAGKVSAGDLITTQAYPVLTRGAPDYVDVEVSEV